MFVAGFGRCHDFEELNTNPYAPIYDPTVENVSADGIDIDYTLTEHAMASLKGMEGAIGSIFANFTYEGPYNDYQTTTNLTHDIYAGYWQCQRLCESGAYLFLYGWMVGPLEAFL